MLRRGVRGCGPPAGRSRSAWGAPARAQPHRALRRARRRSRRRGASAPHHGPRRRTVVSARSRESSGGRSAWLQCQSSVSSHSYSHQPIAASGTGAWPWTRKAARPRASSSGSGPALSASASRSRSTNSCCEDGSSGRTRSCRIDMVPSPSSWRRESTGVDPLPARSRSCSGATRPRTTDRSDPRGRALEEGQVPDLGRSEVDAAGGVLAHPALGHRDRGVGILVGLPQAQRHALPVTEVREAVPDEAGLLLERAEHPLPDEVGELLERAVLDLIRCDAYVLHVCALLRSFRTRNRPRANVSQIESRVRSGYQGFAETSDGTGSADAISVTPASPIRWMGIESLLVYVFARNTTTPIRYSSRPGSSAAQPLGISGARRPLGSDRRSDIEARGLGGRGECAIPRDHHDGVVVMTITDAFASPI